MKLPTWRDCSWRSAKGFSTSALDKFIFKYEPTNRDEQAEWRELLSALIDEDRADTISQLEQILEGEKDG